MNEMLIEEIKGLYETVEELNEDIEELRKKLKETKEKLAAQFDKTQGAENKNAALRVDIIEVREALRALLEACYQADEMEELSEMVDGSLLDKAKEALERNRRENE